MIYDVIGDVHGQADKLEGLLKQLGYHDNGRYYEPPNNHHALFIGDLIDRGEQEVKTLQIAFAMLDAGVAEIVMGNHEYNALAYATLNEHTNDGSYLREHSSRNQRQHAAFLAEVPWQSAAHDYWLQRFYELPLWLETEHACFVHACWDVASMQQLQPLLTHDNKLTTAGLQATGQKHSAAYNALERVLKGVETPLPNGMYITDKGGTKRHNVRVKWWLDELNERPIQEIARVPKSDEAKLAAIPKQPSGEPIEFELATQKPIFIGHYWMRGIPQPLSKQVVCTDYSAAAKDGFLTCYQFDTQQPLPLLADNFIWFDHTS